MEYMYLHFWLVSLCCIKINSGKIPNTSIMIEKNTAYLQYLKTSPLVVLPDVGGECCAVCFGGGETVTLGISHVVAVGRERM